MFSPVAVSSIVVIKSVIRRPSAVRFLHSALKDLTSIQPVRPVCLSGYSEISSAVCKWELLPELVCCALPRTGGKRRTSAKDHYSFPSLSTPTTRWDYFPVSSLLSPHRKSK